MVSKSTHIESKQIYLKSLFICIGRLFPIQRGMFQTVVWVSNVLLIMGQIIGTTDEYYTKESSGGIIVKNVDDIFLLIKNKVLEIM